MTISETRLRKLRELQRQQRAKHRDCPCGCGELADECMTGANPLGAFDISQPQHAISIHTLDEEDDL